MMLLLDPNDVLMFRESKPFGIEYHLARTTLPLPQTIAGAIRSAIYLSNDPDTVRDVIGYGEEEPSFEILGVFFYRKRNGEIEVLSECPRDISSDFWKIEPYKINQMDVTIFKGKNIHFKSFDGFFNLNGLPEYLTGSEIDSKYLVNKDEIFVTERRIGIALTESRVTKEEHLYQTETLRLKDSCGLAVWIGNDLSMLDSSGMLRLGGEGRFAKFRKLHTELKVFAALSEQWKNIRKRINESGRLKLYLATPAVFGENEYTSRLDNELRKMGIKRVENVFSLVGKPVSFSGWDYVVKKPKPTRYAVPAGSVYFVEFEGELNLNKPYVKLGKLTKLGYGLCFVGVW